MKKSLLMILILVAALPVSSFAASRTVSGDGGGNWNFKEEAAVAETKKEETVSSGPGSSGTVYEFDGKRYVIDTDWGCHYLTGFCPNADGSRRTRSGSNATEGYTVSSTKANLGKVILIQAEEGPAGTDIHRYDGLYKCEDTGGEAVEYGKANTGYTPVVDIFFDTEEDANHVSASGWINARIYILREVD